MCYVDHVFFYIECMVFNSEQLTEVFKSHSHKIYAYVAIRIGNKAAAEDIVQEAFAKAWRSRKHFDPNKGELASWLFTITRNTMYDYLKASSKQKIVDLNIEIIDDLLSVAPEDNSRWHLLMQRIATLSDRDQDLLLLRYKAD